MNKKEQAEAIVNLCAGAMLFIVLGRLFWHCMSVLANCG
jgi:hypothetical protein